MLEGNRVLVPELSDRTLCKVECIHSFQAPQHSLREGLIKDELNHPTLCWVVLHVSLRLLHSNHLLEVLAKVVYCLRERYSIVQVELIKLFLQVWAFWKFQH